MRMMFPSLVALCAFAPLAASAQNPICAPTGEIVAAAVEARGAGQPLEVATAAITEGLDAAQQDYAPAVPPLVDWVYDLPEEDLQKNVAGAWVAQCEAQ